MSSQTITVAAIEAPGIGKKQGRIVDSTGKKWNVWADKLANYQQFRTYEIVYETNEFKGIIFDVIKSAVMVSGSPTPTYIAPKSAAPPSVTYDPNQTRIDIFVSVMINNSKFDPATAPEQELVDVLNKFKRIWKRVYGPQPLARGSLDTELNDSIPDFE